MRKNKLFSFTVAVVLIIAVLVTACTSRTPAPQTSEEVSATQVPETTQQIVVPMWSGPEYDNLVKTAKVFEETTGIKVIIEEIARDAYEAKLTTVLLAGSSDYDVAYINSSFLPKHVEAQTLEPLETFNVANNPNLPDLAPAVNALYYKGKLYGLPTEADCVYMYYRTDILKENGIEPPDTWEDFLAAAKKVNSPSRYYGTIVAAKLPNYVFYDFSSWLLGTGTTWTDENYNPQWNTPGAIEALTRYVNAVKEGYAPPDATAIEYPEINSLYQEGKVAMIIQWVAARAELLDCALSPKVCEKTDVKIVPAFGSAPNERMIAGSLFSWSIPRASKNKEAAYKFISWITSKEGGSVWALNGGIPANQKALTNPVVLKVRPDFELLAESLKYVRTPPDTTVSTDLVSEASLEINAAVAGTKSPEDAAQAIQKAWENMLKEAGYLK